MTHRKHSRTRNAIHKAMARNPGQRMPKWMRIKSTAEQKKDIAEFVQAARDQADQQSIKQKPDLQTPVEKRPGFMRRLFNRKTGGS